MGYQKDGVLVVARQERRLSQRLAELNVGSVEWAEFPSGPPLLEALAADGVDFGATGDTPPIFAQSAGAQLAYVAAVPVNGTNYAILVPPDSRIPGLAGLRGKRIAFARGSSAHYFTIVALKSAGLSLADVMPVHLAPPDARAAFSAGSIDAWAIWDPFFADAQKNAGARVLTTAAPFGKGATFFLAARAFAEQNPAIIRAILDELRETSRWIGANREKAAALVSRSTGISLDILKLAFGRVEFDVVPVSPWIIARQQILADTFAGLGLIRRPILVKDAVLSVGWK